MEQLNLRGRHFNRNEIARTISAAELRDKFSRKIMEWANVANGKGLSLDVNFSNDLPDYFYGDEGFFTEVINGLLEFSIDNTSEGMVNVMVTPIFSKGSNLWWLTVKVDDSSNGLSPGMIGYIYGLEADLFYDDLCCSSIARVRRLREMCRLYGGQMEIENMDEENCTKDKYGWGNRYLIRIPYRIISLSQLVLGSNYLS